MTIKLNCDQFLHIWSGVHPEIFKGGAGNFLKSNQYSIAVNLFKSLMQLRATNIIVKHDFTV